jgi:hypothetical protein
MRSIHLLFAASCILFITACGGAKNTKKDAKNDSTQVDTSAQQPAPQVDAELDDLARLLAGLPPNKNYKNIADTGFYRKYKASMDFEWAKLEKEMIQPILQWQKENVNQTLKGNKTCFYPFSGADFLYANLFFPDANNYILIGLEPPGSITDPNKMSKDELSSYLYSNDNAMGMSHDKGFYRTNSMRVDFSKNHLNGTVHNILFYIVRRGYMITGIEYFDLDSNTGKPNYTKAVFGEKNSKYGVKVKFTDDKGGDKAVYYLGYNIWNPMLKGEADPIFKFVDSFNGHYLFLKAASYLSQYPGYTLMHNYMLNTSSLIVQDDSGIPYTSLNNEAWNVQLWGNFETVLPLFHNYNQPELKKAYDEVKEIKKLPFAIGYNVSLGESNLQYCIRDFNKKPFLKPIRKEDMTVKKEDENN